MNLSVIVVVLEGGPSLDACLRALSAQAEGQSTEILVPWDSTRGKAPVNWGTGSAVRFLPLDGPRTYAELRAFGIRRSSGAIVALTEDHCIPAPDWCAQILECHQSTHAAIGGAVQKDEPDTALNWSFYFADYIRYLDPAEGPSDHLTDCNVTYKRRALTPILDLWQVEFHENTIHEALKQRRESLWLTPRIMVRQRRRFELAGALWDRYAFGRLFGSTRVSAASTPTRLKMIAVSPLLPILLVVRSAGHVARTGRYAAAFVRSLPLLALLSVTWAWGECVGYITGRPEEVLAAKARPVVP